MLALALLSENLVAFTSEHRASYRVPVTANPGLRADPQATLEEALIRFGLDPDRAASDMPDAGFALPAAACPPFPRTSL